MPQAGGLPRRTSPKPNCVVAAIAVLPLNFLLSGIMFHLSGQSFDEVGLKV